MLRSGEEHVFLWLNRDKASQKIELNFHQVAMVVVVLLSSWKPSSFGEVETARGIPTHGKWRANALNIYECDRKQIFLLLCPSSTSRSYISVVNKDREIPFYSTQNAKKGRMKQRNAIIVSMLLLSLFSGPLSISECVYLFILFHPQKENSFEVGSGKC